MTDIMRVLSATSQSWISNDPGNRRWATPETLLSKDEIEAIILEHIYDVICADDADNIDTLFDFLGDLVHRPEVAPAYGIAFVSGQGAEGAGVSLYLQLLRKALGDQDCYYGHGLPKNVEATLKSKKLMILYGICGGAVPPVKTILTSGSNCRLITTASFAGAQILKGNYRNIKVIEVSSKRVGDFLYFKRLAQAIEQGGAEIYRDYLMSK